MSEGTNDVNIDVSDQSNGSPGITKVDEKHEMMENTLIFIESTAFVCITGLLIATLIVDRLRDTRIWDFEMWKWCCLILAVLCGRLLGYLFTEAQVKLIWKICSRRPWIERAIYFAYGVKKSIIVFIWLGLVFLAWALLFDSGVKRSKEVRKILNDVTRGLAGCLIGIAIWLVKTLLVKLVASFHVKTLFERIKEANCNRKILEAVSNKKKDSEEDTSELLNAIRVKKLPRLCCGENGRIKMEDEEGAKKAANEIFKELVVPNDQKYMDLNILLDLVKHKEECPDCQVAKETCEHFRAVAEDKTGRNEQNNQSDFRNWVTQRLNGDREAVAGDKKIKKSVFRNWVVKVYKDYESVNSALKYRKTAVDELNKLASVVVLFVIIIVWLLFMEFLTTKIVVFMTSQLLLVVFMFGNTVKTVFEAIIFVFVMHPFDVGDRCLIDGIQMTVDEMEILTTTFLRFDNARIYYPNSVLSTKSICNFYRSPPMMDSVEFAIDLHTRDEKITKLQNIIKKYLESNPRRWRSDHSLQFKEIEDMNKMKVILYFSHTINFHDAAKRGKRRSELVLHMRIIFEVLGIEYHLLPQQVHLKQLI
ncbi:hypothetical protein P3X46_007571 [Hevea brasiliensis]|uniref:Mechanosensitive ion channel MscS domain-containing protein n=1 Tax=Hevea brasiliensis TaxID=3981 RepID=A0ABQ9MY26_HEVBR|nr:mechanosensitive ion channel protein 10-like [Hevea brasiliensis]KAJ9183759.1 hypothetical protein P3X46_007571 [Hevea brasiliensis]